MRLLLIRHGQTASNVENRLDSAVPGPLLTPLGEAQAAAIPDQLAAERVDVLYASTQTRAQLTAAPLARHRGLPVTIRDGLREIFAGDLEGRTDDEAVTTYVRTTLAWADGDVSRRMPGAEDGVEVLGRFDAVVSEVAASGAEVAVVVSHGAMIRTWSAARAHNLDAGFAASNALVNTGIVVLDGDPVAGWYALSWQGTRLLRG
ncbi:histidine phosphatase family protein [Cellulomonas sp. P24]|uniref:histidine phosphatase family protein n=1 Tax=Cellulomonas sp. P24 TaxID=2885206 RepID=UPI00216B1038|nr:histidine phosphatase family protein [Cellulomonas sp. P24]MCR6493800.1 histidine phosphatase family protein [Cellulomonas sp. P24]